MNNLDYQKDGLIGLNYLLKFIREKDLSYLSVIEEKKDAIKFWILVTFLQNNHELIFDEVDNDTLNKLFNLVPIQKNKTDLLFDDGKMYDYGIGIKTNSTLDYRLQFKLIRNAIAHNDYEINDNIIKVVDKRYNYEAIFDYKWFEAAVMCTLSNRNYQFKSGLNDIFLTSMNNKNPVTRDELFKFIDTKAYGITKLTLTTNSTERVCKSLNFVHRSDIKFYSLLYYIKDLLMKKVASHLPIGKDAKITDQNFYNAVLASTKDLNKELSGSFTLEYIPFTREFVNSLNLGNSFDELPTFKSQLEVLFHQYKTKYFPELNNTLAFKYVLDIFIILENNLEFDSIHMSFLDDVYNLVFKSMGNLVFNSVLSGTPNYGYFSNQIFKKYESKMSYDFGTAKNYYKNYLKKLNNMIEDTKKNGFPFEKTKELVRFKERIISLNQKLDALNKGKNPEIFFSQMRNIFAHGYCLIDGNNIRLYDKDIKRYYYRFSKSKGTWEEKEIDEDAVIYNLNMSYEVFLNMINDIVSSLNYSLDENIKDNLKL